jgi:hypothetical protein
VHCIIGGGRTLEVKCYDDTGTLVDLGNPWFYEFAHESIDKRVDKKDTESEIDIFVRFKATTL